IILKWAQSLDGFIAPENRDKREPIWITNSISRQLVHKWRAEEQGIMVGTNTAVEDDPKLDTRLWDGPNPVRIILDKDLRVPSNSAVYNGESITIILHGFNTQADENLKEQKALKLIPIDFGKDIISQICRILYEEHIQSVIIEGGARTLQ